MLGADHVVATRMEVVDGKYTGEIDYYAYAENKAARDPRRSPSERGYDLDAQLRLQRLGHRRAHARGGRPPVRGQPRPGAAPGRAATAAGRCWSSPSRSRCAAGCRCRRQAARSPRWPSGRRVAVGGAVWVAARRRPTAATPERRPVTQAAESQPLWRLRRRGVQRRQQLTDPHVSQVPTRRSTLPTGRCPSGIIPGQQLDDARLVARSHVSAAAPRVLASSGAALHVRAPVSAVSRRSGLASAPCGVRLGGVQQPGVHARPAPPSR